MPGTPVKRYRYARSLSPNEVIVLEWAIECLSDTVKTLADKWDSDTSKRNCETAAKAVGIMRDLLERLR